MCFFLVTLRYITRSVYSPEVVGKVDEHLKYNVRICNLEA